MAKCDKCGGELGRTFPIQRSLNRYVVAYPMQIPWSVAELAYSVYASRYGVGQSLEVLAGRGGGFGPGEMDEFLPGWRDRCDEIVRLRGDRKKLVDYVRDMRDNYDCDADSHRYNTPCRVCEARELLESIGEGCAE
jgi:hypothetical protein